MKTSMKIGISFVLILLMIVLGIFPSFAHKKQEDHYKEIRDVLFGDKYPTCKNYKKIREDIEFASYLTIDQFQGDGKDKYKRLKRDGMSGLPIAFEIIDYEYHPDYENKKINANTHHLYTHQGWDRDYSSKSSKIERFWSARRNVLLGTLNSIFDFRRINVFGYDEKCNALAGIIYYIHILGDYEAADDYKKIQTLTPLAGKMEIANDKDKDYDMITSLKSYINVLFSNQDTADLIKELEKIEKKASKIQKSVGGVNTDEEFKEYHGYAIDVLETLKKYIPDLLYEEDFFRSVFYPTE